MKKKPFRTYDMEKMQFHKRYRFCDNCIEPIRNHDKYKIIELEDVRVRVHINCKYPTSYNPLDNN